MLIRLQHGGFPGIAFEAHDTVTTGLQFVGRASAHVQTDIVGRPHSTAKERDPETGEANGNDYFGARYYASSMSRFLSPDWSAKLEGTDPVPYAKLDNPQTLTLYAYLLNNPLSGVDADGHQSGSGSCQMNPDGKNSCTDTDTNLAQEQSNPSGSGPDPVKLDYTLYVNGRAHPIYQQMSPPGGCEMSDFLCRMKYRVFMAWLAQRPQIKAPSNQPPPTPEQLQRAKDCRDGWIGLGIAAVTTVGMAAAIYYAWPVISAGAIEEGAAGGFEAAEAAARAAGLPLAAIGITFNKVEISCGSGK